MATSLAQLKLTRRRRLSLLVDHVGQNQLAELTGVSAAYLYQMAKGSGSSARSVSDSNARLIEERAGLPRLWLDSEEHGGVEEAKQPAPVSQSVRPDVAILAQSIEAVDIALDRAGMTLPAKSRAAIAAHLYAEAAGSIPNQSDAVAAALTAIIRNMRDREPPK